MSDLANYPLEDGYESTLAQAWNGAIGTVYLNDAPSFTFPTGVTTYIVVNPGKTTMQVAEIDSIDSGAGTVNVSNITIEKGAGVNYTQQTHGVNSVVRISDSYEFWKDIASTFGTKVNTDVDSQIADGIELQFGANGGAIYSDDDGTNLKFKDGSNPPVDLSTLASGGGADTKVAVSVTDTTTSTLDAKLTAGDGIKKTIVDPAGDESLDLDIDLTDTTIFSTTGEADKVLVADSDGKIPSTLVLDSHFGDGSDGAIPDSSTNISGLDNTYIQKNYTSWTAGSVARTFSINPVNCITHIRIQGDADFTNWTLDFSGKGGEGGAAPSEGINGADGIQGNTNNLLMLSDNGNGGLQGSASSTAASALAVNTLLTTDIDLYPVVLFAGAGGGSGGGGTDAVDTSTGGDGGAGGNGGGCVIIEVGGNVTFSSTTATVAGDGGSVGQNANGNNGSGGGGGAGAGGSFVLLYAGTVTGTLTPVVLGGTGGVGGVGGSNIGGAGGSGGASIFIGGTAGSGASGGTNNSTGGPGGNGAVGNYIIRAR